MEIKTSEEIEDILIKCEGYGTEEKEWISVESLLSSKFLSQEYYYNLIREMEK